MKAVTRSGGNPLFNENYPKPTCGAKDVLVQIKAAGINPIDYKMPWPILGRVMGLEFSGVVTEKGSNITNFDVGDEVFGGVSGSLAEFALCDPTKIAKKPKTVSFEEASVMLVTYLTSFQCLRDYGKLQKGGRVLIIGASGGCGTAAIQLAKSMGAKDIVGVCSGKNAEFIKSLGATEVIDYTQQTLTSYGRDGETSGDILEEKKFDVIYDAATGSGGGENYKDSSYELLRAKSKGHPHGQYVAINGSPWTWLRGMTIGLGANQHIMYTNVNAKDLDILANLMDEGWNNDQGEIEKLKPAIQEAFPFTDENVQKGFELLKSRRTVGKLVFSM